MKREISKLTSHTVNAEPFPEALDPVAWLHEQAAQAAQGTLLLAHADDGVIWGKVVDGTLLTMPQNTPLRAETLQQARLFNAQGECYVWRDGDGKFYARIITDSEGAPIECFDEPQILWGDRAELVDHGFTMMSDGAQGLVHYVPIQVTKARAGKRPLRLTVRHYLKQDDNGFVRVAYSRLVKLEEK
jgi:CRISPR-associated protein (TIGR03984 family)